MRIGRITGHTAELSPPPDWDKEANGHCGTLFVRGELINGVHFMRSAWEAEPCEALFQLAGGKLILGIAGRQHPVVHLAVEAPPEDFQPMLTAQPAMIMSGTETVSGVHVEVLYPNSGSPKRGVVDVVIGPEGMGAAIAFGLSQIEDLARGEGWIA